MPPPTELSPPPPGYTLAACAECDQLVHCPSPCRQGSAHCPTCGSALASSRTFKPAVPLAIALTALILAIPANIYPQLTFSFLGQPNYYTLWGGAQHLLNTGFWWVGLLVITGTVIAPLALLALILLLCLGWFGGFSKHLLYPLLKAYRHLSSWAMLDVYLLAVIVSVVKLQDMGDFALAQGFYCFVLLLLSLSAAVATFNQERFWELLEERECARH